MLKDAPPDFVILCSSHTAITGGFGQVSYCAANAFLDALAHQVTAQGGPRTIAIDWDRWRGVGMAVGVETRHKALTGDMYTGGMAPHEGVEAFHRILASYQLPQVVVSIQDFQALLTEHSTFGATSALQVLEGAQLSQSTQPRPNLKTVYVAPRDEIEHRIAKIWQDVIGLEQIGVLDNFFEIGGDSLIALQLVGRIRKAFAVELPLRTLFDTPTVAGLAFSLQKDGGTAEGISGNMDIQPQAAKSIDQLLAELDLDG
jgi:acyl carrier protein